MKVAEYYNNSYANHQLKADSMRIDRLRFAFEDTPREAKILNVGCGPGADIDFLLKAGNEVHGVDISDAALSLAEKRGIIPHKLDLTLLEELPLNDISCKRTKSFLLEDAIKNSFWRGLNFTISSGIESMGLFPYTFLYLPRI